MSSAWSVRRRYSRAALLCAACCLLLCCGGSGHRAAANATAVSAAAPDRVAHDWVEAAFAEDGETLNDLTCAAKKTELKAGRAAVTAFLLGSEALIPVEKPRIARHDLTYTPRSTQGDRIDVRVDGSVVVEEALLSRSQKVKDKTIHLQRENGQWKWCGF